MLYEVITGILRRKPGCNLQFPNRLLQFSLTVIYPTQRIVNIAIFRFDLDRPPDVLQGLIQVDFGVRPAVADKILV